MTDAEDIAEEAYTLGTEMTTLMQKYGKLTRILLDTTKEIDVIDGRMKNIRDRLEQLAEMAGV